MKRKDFLAALPLLASLPFLKKKPGMIPGKELLTSADIAEHYDVPTTNLQNYESVAFNNLEEKQREFLEQLSKRYDYVVKRAILTPNEIKPIES